MIITGLLAAGGGIAGLYYGVPYVSLYDGVPYVMGAVKEATANALESTFSLGLSLVSDATKGIFKSFAEIVFENIDIKESLRPIGTAFNENVKEFAKSAFENIDIKDSLRGLGTTFNENLREMGNEAGESVREGMKNFFHGEGAKQITRDLFQGVQELVSNDDVHEGINNFTKGAGSNFTHFFKSISEFLTSDSFREGVQGMGDDIHNAVNDLTFPGIDAITDVFGRLAGNISLAALTTIIPTVAIAGAAIVGTPLATMYLYRRAVHRLGRPKLLMESRSVSFLTPLTNTCSRVCHFVFGAMVKELAIFNETVSRRIAEISASVKNAYKHGGNLENLLLWGPGGTGKTLIAREIAKNAGCNFYLISGADLQQYGNQAVTELNKILSWAKRNRKPTILFIDEIDALAGKRDGMGAERLDLLTALLKETGTASKKLMIIGATNRKDSLDPAFLTRMPHKVYIGPPDWRSRFGILKQNVSKQFRKTKELTTVLDDSALSMIASKTYGLSGRFLDQLVSILANKRHATKDCKLTSEMIDQTVYELVMQERDMPDTVRSWYPIELTSDLWYFTLGSIHLMCLRAFTGLGNFSIGNLGDRIYKALAISEETV